MSRFAAPIKFGKGCSIHNSHFNFSARFIDVSIFEQIRGFRIKLKYLNNGNL